MGLMEDLNAPEPRRKMRLEEILESLDAKEHAAVLAAIEDPRVSDQRVADALTKNGHSIVAGSVRAWRLRASRG